MNFCFTFNFLFFSFYRNLFKQNRCFKHTPCIVFICILKSSVLLPFFNLSDNLSGSYFLGCSVVHSFVKKVLLQLKEVGVFLFYILQLQDFEDFDCE